MKSDASYNYLINQIKNAKKINFLIGSGCSKDIIPTLDETFSNFDFLEKLEEDFKNDENNEIFLIIKEYININKKINIETFLNFITDTQSTFESIKKYDESIVKLNSYFNRIKKVIMDSIFDGMKKVDNDYKTFKKAADNYINFIDSIYKLKNAIHFNTHASINFFTTNYDLMLEYAMEHCNINYTTGFSGEYKRVFSTNNFNYKNFNEELDDKSRFVITENFAKIYKLHGSINWFFSNDLIEMAPISFLNEHSLKNDIIIYPTKNKFKETLLNPYNSLIRSFSNQLQKTSNLLVVIGFGFNHNHINDIIENSLNENLLVIILTKDKESILSKFKNRKKIENNISFITSEENDEIKRFYFENIVNYLKEYITKKDNNFDMEEEK